MTKMNSTLSSGWWIFLSIVTILVGLFVAKIFIKRPTLTHRTNRTNREVALVCTSDMATQFHIHPHLTIMINGQAQAIPANIGIQPGCMNALHTHDNTGTIHVESPEQRDFTLADWFTVWGKPFDKDHILAASVDASSTIQVTINGKEVDTFENTILKDGEQIVISYGKKK